MGDKAVKTEDDWQREATLAAIVAARAVVSGDGINGRAQISSLSEVEWGWIAAAAIFGWIKTRAEQAVSEGQSSDLYIRTAKHRDPEPWEAGAVGTILPQLGNLQNVDWSKPIGEWSKDQITGFSWQIYRLINQSMAARDEGSLCTISKKLNPERVEREISAANKGPLMSRKELNDAIPF